MTTRRSFLASLGAALAGAKALLAGDTPPRGLPAAPAPSDSQSSTAAPFVASGYSQTFTFDSPLIVTDVTLSSAGPGGWLYTVYAKPRR